MIKLLVINLTFVCVTCQPFKVLSTCVNGCNMDGDETVLDFRIKCIVLANECKVDCTCIYTRVRRVKSMRVHICISCYLDSNT